MPILTLNRTAGGAIAAYRIVTRGADEKTDVQADAASDALLGVNGPMAAASGERFDACVLGLAEVEYGGSVVRGNPLTADSDGRAIAATVNGQRIIGVAWEDGDEGTIGSVLLSPGVMATTTLAAASVSVADAGGLLTATNVEAALAEVATAAAG